MPPVEETEAMRRGSRIEDTAKQLYAELTGHIVMEAIAICSQNPRLMASLDGITMEMDHCVEIKRMKLEYHQQVGDGECPRLYYGQLQHTMMCTGHADMVIFSVQANDQDQIYSSHCLTVARDEEYIAKLYEACKAALHCLDTNTPPPLIERDYRKRQDQSYEAAEEYLMVAKKKRDEGKREYEDAKKKLIELSGGLNTMGLFTRLTNYTLPGKIDYKAIPELASVDLEKYRKPPTLAWRISIGDSEE